MAETPTKTRVHPLAADLTTRPNIWDGELHYYADGTRVGRRGVAKPTYGTTVGITVDAIPYQFQAVKWDDGTETNTAPQVLEKVTEDRLHEPCSQCQYPIAIVDGALHAPGGLDKRLDRRGRTWLTPHSAICTRRTRRPR